MNKTAPPLVSDIERLLNAGGDKNAAVNAPLLFNMMGGELVRNVVRTTPMRASSYYAVGTLATEDGVNPGVPVTSALVENPAMFAEKGLGPDQSCIRGRVDKVRNNVVPARHYKDYANEFVTSVVGRSGGHPLTIDEVRVAQSTAQQRGRFKLAEPTLTTKPVNKLKAFIKSEPYNNATDPRNITTMSAETTILMSSFTLAFKRQVLKSKPWYGPGKSPDQITSRLRELAELGHDWLATDFSRLDGTVSAFLRSIYERCIMRWCHVTHRAELKRLLDQINIKQAVTANGFKYDAGTGTRSGSPQTTDTNTTILAFVVYASFRQLGYSVKDSMTMLSCLYGDDGATPNYPGLQDMLQTVCKDLGLLLKCSVIDKNDPLPFLGRYFVHPLTTTDSFQDPMRTIAKLHLSSNKQVSPEQAAANKAHGYLATDHMTPIISDWALRVCELTGLGPKGLTSEEVYKTSNAWPQKDQFGISVAFAQVIGWTGEEIAEMRTKVRTAPALDAFPVILNNEPTEIKIPCVVDGILEPGPRNNNGAENQPTADTGEVRGVESKGEEGSSNADIKPDGNTSVPEGEKRTTGSQGNTRGKRPANQRPRRPASRPVDTTNPGKRKGRRPGKAAGATPASKEGEQPRTPGGQRKKRGRKASSGTAPKPEPAVGVTKATPS